MKNLIILIILAIFTSCNSMYSNVKELFSFSGDILAYQDTKKFNLGGNIVGVGGIFVSGKLNGEDELIYQVQVKLKGEDFIRYIELPAKYTKIIISDNPRLVVNYKFEGKAIKIREEYYNSSEGRINVFYKRFKRAGHYYDIYLYIPENSIVYENSLNGK